jgi:hypothetical protein
MREDYEMRAELFFDAEGMSVFYVLTAAVLVQAAAWQQARGQ